MDILHLSWWGLTNFAGFLSAHPALAYIILFLGSYFETFIGVSFFVYGEFFFIPGALLAGVGVLNIWLVAFAVYTGGILGDSSSYWIGRRWGSQLFKREGRIFNRINHERGKKFFAAHGIRAVFFARFLGPLSWVTPFFAGMYHVPYGRFLRYNVPAVILGIGQFLIAGYVFGTTYQGFMHKFESFHIMLLLLIIPVLITVYFIHRSIKQLS